MSTTSRCFRWVFTLNDWTDDDITRFESNLKDDVHCLVYQKEANENGTQRLSGFVIFKKQKRFNQVKSLLGPRVRLSLMKGHPLTSLMQPSTSIEGNKPYIYGTIPQRRPGKRRDIDSFKESVREGILDESELLKLHNRIVAKYPNFVHKYISTYRQLNQN